MSVSRETSMHKEKGNTPSTRNALSQAQVCLEVRTHGAGFTDITGRIGAWLDNVGARSGLLTAFIRHTSASLTIQENADPDVQMDLMRSLDRLAPESQHYAHDTEGPDDMPAHIKSMVTSTSLSIPVIDRQMALGTWQALYLIEHRASPHRREVVLHFLGDVCGPNASP